jgi:hypothetical protein
MRRYIPLVIVAALLVAACGKNEDARPGNATRPLVKPEEAKPSAAPTPSPPAPHVPKGSAAPSPKPGQANDHSNPEFKGGGVPDKQK